MEDKIVELKRWAKEHDLTDTDLELMLKELTFRYPDRPWLETPEYFQALKTLVLQELSDGREIYVEDLVKVPVRVKRRVLTALIVDGKIVKTKDEHYVLKRKELEHEIEGVQAR